MLFKTNPVCLEHSNLKAKYSHCPRVSRFMLCHMHSAIAEFSRKSDSGINISWSTFVHHLSQPERLGITWRLYCTSLAVCAKDMPGARPRLILAMKTQTMRLPLCQIICLSVSETCLHTHVHTHCHAFQVDHIWSLLQLWVFSWPQARVLYAHICAIVPAPIWTHMHTRDHACT